MEIEYNKFTKAGYQWLNIYTIAKRLDYKAESYIIVFNDMTAVAWWEDSGYTVQLLGPQKK